MKKAIISITFIATAFLLGYFILFSDNLCSANELNDANKQGYETSFNNSESYKKQLDTLTSNYYSLNSTFEEEIDKSKKLKEENLEQKKIITSLETELKNSINLEQNDNYAQASDNLNKVNEEYHELFELFGNKVLVNSQIYELGDEYIVGSNSEQQYLITSFSGTTTQVSGGYCLILTEQKYTITEVVNE